MVTVPVARKRSSARGTVEGSTPRLVPIALYGSSSTQRWYTILQRMSSSYALVLDASWLNAIFVSTLAVRARADCPVCVHVRADCNWVTWVIKGTAK